MPLWRKSGWMFRNYNVRNSAVYFSARGILFYRHPTLKKLLAIKSRFYRRLRYKDLTPLDGRQPIQEKL